MYHCYIIDISFIYYIIDILSLYQIHNIYIGGCVKIRVWIGQRWSKHTDRSGSPAFWYGRVWIGGMDQPVGSGYGSGLYISTRSLYIYIPYGSKHLLKRYLTPQIIPQTLPKKVLGSIGIYIQIYIQIWDCCCRCHFRILTHWAVLFFCEVDARRQARIEASPLN